MVFPVEQSGRFSNELNERARREAERYIGRLDGMGAIASVERTQIPGQPARQIGNGAAMAGQAIGRVIQNQMRANEQVDRAKATAPIIRGTDTEWNNAFQSDQTFGYDNDTNWSPSSWTEGGMPETSGNSFRDVFDPGVQEAMKAQGALDFAKDVDWSKTVFGS